MRITVEHKTTKEIARRKVEERLGQLLAQFGGHAEEIHHEWIGDTLKFKGKARGFKVEGTMEVSDSSVVIDSKLPMVAMLFEGKIRHAVQREADAMFA